MKGITVATLRLAGIPNNSPRGSPTRPTDCQHSGRTMKGSSPVKVDDLKWQAGGKV